MDQNERDDEVKLDESDPDYATVCERCSRPRPWRSASTGALLCHGCMRPMEACTCRVDFYGKRIPVA